MIKIEADHMILDLPRIKKKKNSLNKKYNELENKIKDYNELYKARIMSFHKLISNILTNTLKNCDQIENSFNTIYNVFPKSKEFHVTVNLTHKLARPNKKKNYSNSRRLVFDIKGNNKIVTICIDICFDIFDYTDETTLEWLRNTLVKEVENKVIEYFKPGENK